MASKKFLQKAAADFRKKEPYRCALYGWLCTKLAGVIRKKGVAEATVGIRNGMYYEEA
jgi:hypothetical protein